MKIRFQVQGQTVCAVVQNTAYDQKTGSFVFLATSGLKLYKVQAKDAKVIAA